MMKHNQRDTRIMDAFQYQAMLLAGNILVTSVIMTVLETIKAGTIVYLVALMGVLICGIVYTIISLQTERHTRFEKFSKYVGLLTSVVGILLGYLYQMMG